MLTVYYHLTLPKSNLQEAEAYRSISICSLFSIVFDTTQVKFSLSQSFFFSPNGFDLGRVDCMLYCF